MNGRKISHLRNLYQSGTEEKLEKAGDTQGRKLDALVSA